MQIEDVERALTGSDLLEMAAGIAGATLLWGVIGVGVGAVIRNQVGAIVSTIVWSLLPAPLLQNLYPEVGSLHAECSERRVQRVERLRPPLASRGRARARAVGARVRRHRRGRDGASRRAVSVERRIALHRQGGRTRPLVPSPVLRVVARTARVIHLAGLVALAFTGLGDLVFYLFDGLPWWAQMVVYTAIAIGLTRPLLTPISFWTGYRREHAWGFSTQTVGGWALDRVKGLGLGIVLTGAAMVGIVGLARWLPSWWALAAAVLGSVLVVLLTFVAPVVLEPVFNRFTPLEDEELARSLRELSVRAGVPRSSTSSSPTQAGGRASRMRTCPGSRLYVTRRPLRHARRRRRPERGGGHPRARARPSPRRSHRQGDGARRGGNVPCSCSCSGCCAPVAGAPRRARELMVAAGPARRCPVPPARRDGIAGARRALRGRRLTPLGAAGRPDCDRTDVRAGCVRAGMRRLAVANLLDLDPPRVV